MARHSTDAAAPAATPGGARAKAKEKPKGFVASVKSILPAVAIALAIRAFLFEPFSIPSGSMLPTLQIGDYVVVTKFAYGIRVPFTNDLLWERGLPRRGDVIVFERPTPPSENLIKRVVGLPGDEIRLQEGVVYVNGQRQGQELVETAYALDDYDERTRRWFATRANLYVERLERQGGEAHPHFVLDQQRDLAPEGPFRVPEGHVLVLGDNRDNSMDSRSWGYVPLGNVRGRADVIGFSWGQDGLRTDRLFRGIDAGLPQGS